MAMTRDGVAIRAILWLAAGAALARLATLGLYPLLDTTEARYAEIARKMAELGDWITPWFDYGVPFWGKPPLAFWLTAASFKLFGVGEFAARLPHLLSAILVGWLVWDWSAKRSRREAAYALGLLSGSFLYFVTAGAVITDTSLFAGTTLAMRGFWLGLHGAEAQRRRERWLLFLGLGLGLLAKGPVALVLAGLPVAIWTFATVNTARVWRDLPWLRGGLLTLALALPWYMLAETRTPGFLNYFLVGEHWQRFVTPGWQGDLYGRAHAFPRGTIWLFAFAALLPWSLLLPAAALRWRKVARLPPNPQTEHGWLLYLLLWGLTPAVFFSAARNILWTYVLPGLPAFALLAAAWLDRYPGPYRADRWVAGGLMLTLVAAAGFLVIQGATGQFDARSAKALVADYQSRRKGDEPLVFLGNPPYSATFYSRGRVVQAPSAAALAALLERKAAFVAIRRREVTSVLAILPQQSELVSRRGDFDLFAVEPRDRIGTRHARTDGDAGGSSPRSY